MRSNGSVLQLVLALIAAAVPVACSSDSSSDGSVATGGTDGSSGGDSGRTSVDGGTSNQGGSSGASAGTGGSAGTSDTGGVNTGGGRSDAGDGGRAGASNGGSTNGDGGAMSDAGPGGAASCTQKPAVSFNDATTGTSDGQFDFQGAWSTSTGAGKFQNDDHYASATGATATFRFEGVSAALHGAKASHHGIAEVRIDGGAATDVDLYAATRAEDVEVWNSGTLGAGRHMLSVRVSGRQNAASTGTTVSVDRVVVDPTTCNTNTGGAGGAGGNVGTGGTVATGGSVGTGGSGGGAVSRPSYNTGPGFFVVGNKLYDANGAEFRIRGVDKLHWDADSPGIPKTHANTERWDIDFSRQASANVSLIQGSVNNHIVPMPGNWQGTCDENASTLSSIVDTWVAQAATWKTMDKYMILNIANEWGPSGTVWRDSYITAIGRLRSAGYLCTISVTSGGCGQDNDDLVNYAKAVFDSDPQKNVIFDQHIYGNWANGGGQSGPTDLATGLDKLVATGLPMIVGEFGPGRGIGPSPTNITPEALMQACETRKIGWMAWAWDDPASNADDTWFALSKNGKYDSSADLTMFGKSVVENATYGLLAVAHPATIF